MESSHQNAFTHVPVALPHGDLSWQRIKLLPYVWQALTWPIGRVLLFILCDLTVKGSEHIQEVPAQKGLLIIANHASDLDGVTLLAGIPPFSRRFPLYYVARSYTEYKWEELWRKIIYAQWFFWLIGAIPILPVHGNYEISLARHIRLLKEGKTVVIFPEGKKRVDPHVIGEVHGGAAYLAETTGASIIPARLTGTYHIQAASLWQGKHQLTVTYGSAISIQDVLDPHDISPERYRNAVRAIMEMGKTLEEARIS